MEEDFQFQKELIEFLQTHALEGIPDCQEYQEELDRLGIN